MRVLLALAVLLLCAGESATVETRNFPAHWGSTPQIQTRDYRPLPGGYGFGSSTLASWIQGNLDRDLAPGVTGSARVSGDLKRWHRVTLDFEGPQTSENAVPNPFLFFRLDVTFTHANSGKTRIVPGFFAADGNAAETSASTGTIWRVRFSPPLEGEWCWRVSLASSSYHLEHGRRECAERRPTTGFHGVAPASAALPPAHRHPQ